ncbi:MAG TPA: hypothetical protein VHQ94_05455 [Pyrinomonadaceae bacterium]|jgi:hypothetical protein|nr:hypothetical protein [Pyrinomonadaceae bacterium]
MFAADGTIEDPVVLIINGEGKIQKDREYFDLAYFQSQLQQ